MPGAAALLLLLAAAPACGPAQGAAALLELNLARHAAGRAPLAPQPLLCRLAAERAAAVAAAGDPEPDGALLQATTRALYRGGYRPHFWSESVLVGSPAAGALAQLRTVRPDWVAAAVEGDFEHAGIGVATRGSQIVVAYLLALPKCTVEWRRVEPLRDLAAVRGEAVAALNRLRSDAGRAALVADPRLDAAAQGHAEAMVERGFYAHRGADGGTPLDRVRAAGYRRDARLAENLAKGLFTPAEAVERWMGSSGHRQNLLWRRAASTGFGVAFGPGEPCVEVVWVQLFADR